MTQGSEKVGGPHTYTHQDSSSPSWSFLTNALKHLYRSIGMVSVLFKVSMLA